jgi:hypothetical protein
MTDYPAFLATLSDKAIYTEFVNRESEDDKERADMAAAEMEKRGLDF